MEGQSILTYITKKDIDDSIFCFPTFYHILGNKKYYFKSVTLELGSIHIVEGSKKSGKSIFLKSLTGLQVPSILPQNRDFLNYDIVYKPEVISPKFSGTLEQFVINNSLKNGLYFKEIFVGCGLEQFKNILVQDLEEEQKQIISFLLFINKHGSIYIFDYPEDKIGENIRLKLWKILKEHCRLHSKAALVVENNDQIRQRLQPYKRYKISSFSDNEYYGQSE